MTAEQPTPTIPGEEWRRTLDQMLTLYDHGALSAPKFVEWVRGMVAGPVPIASFSTGGGSHE